MTEIRAVAPTGFLGDGFDLDAFDNAMSYKPHYIAVDGGSIDPGPFYLGSGTPFMPEHVVKKDLAVLLPAAVRHQIPLIIGSVMGNGTNSQVDLAVGILSEIAKKEGFSLRVAVIQAEINQNELLDRLQSGSQCDSLVDGSPLAEETVRKSERIVAQMGVEPLIEALKAEPDIVVAGRACDDALFAALPILRGADPALSWHMGKILECASLCADPPDLQTPIIGTVRDGSLYLEPAGLKKRCTVSSVTAHTLYERESVFQQFAPGSYIDLTSTSFIQETDRCVKIVGTQYFPLPEYRVKLEGASLAGWRVISIGGIADPVLISQISDVVARVREDVERHFSDERDEYKLSFRLYGYNALRKTEGSRTASSLPREIAVLIEATSSSSESFAEAVCMYARAHLQHISYPGEVATSGNLAYPFSPFSIRAGKAYRFSIYHLLTIKDPLEFFPIEIIEIR